MATSSYRRDKPVTAQALLCLWSRIETAMRALGFVFMSCFSGQDRDVVCFYALLQWTRPGCGRMQASRH